MSSHLPRDLDVLVVGGGPAGAACAIRLAHGGARVAVVEASDFSHFRVGETLDASLGPLLLRLGIRIEQQEWSVPCTGVAAAWGRPDATRRPSMLNPYGRGWRVDRKTFDAALFAQARTAGATAIPRCRFVSAQRHAGSWTFELDTGIRRPTGRARWIVAATGRTASTPLSPGRPRHWIDRLIGLALRDDGAAHRDAGAPDTVLVEATPQGWWYSVCVPDGARVALFFTDSDLLPKGNRERSAFLLNEFDHGPLTRSACEFAAAAIAQHRWTGFDARSSLQRFAMSDGWVAVGDALMAFDPLCGRGIGEAIGSGIEVGDWLLNSHAGEPEPAAVPAWIADAAIRFNHYRSERLATYSQETRWPASRFWERRRA
jgi:flavin-dependent dehydrogenase